MVVTLASRPGLQHRGGKIGSESCQASDPHEAPTLVLNTSIYDMHADCSIVAVMHPFEGVLGRCCAAFCRSRFFQCTSQLDIKQNLIRMGLTLNSTKKAHVKRFF